MLKKKISLLLRQKFWLGFRTSVQHIQYFLVFEGIQTESECSVQS